MNELTKCIRYTHGLPCGSAGKESACNAGDLGLIPGLGRRERLPTPVFWPGEFQGLYSPWGCKESDTTERLSLCLSLCILLTWFLHLLWRCKGSMSFAVVVHGPSFIYVLKSPPLPSTYICFVFFSFLLSFSYYHFLFYSWHNVEHRKSCVSKLLVFLVLPLILSCHLEQ